MPTNYDRIAPHYDRTIRPLENWFLKSLREEAIAALPKGGRLLELGAGTGLNFRLYEATVEGVAIEPSGVMLQIASQKTKPASLRLVQSHAEHLPFADKCFDMVLATLVMCSVQSPERVFAEIRRVVRPGGRISLLEHVRPDGVLGLIFDVLNIATVRLFDDHLNRRTAETARRAGLEVVSVRKIGWGVINLIGCNV